MRTLVLALCLTALSSQAATVKVAVLQIKPLENNLSQTAEVLTEAIVTELGRDKRLDIISASDVSALVGLERQKQLLGCSESSASCLAELSGALGAQYVVVGSLGRVGRQRRLDLRVLDSVNGKALAREGALGTEDTLLEVLHDLAPKLAAAIPTPVQKQPEPVVTVPKQETQPEPVPVAPVEVKQESGPSKVPGAVVTGLGGAMVVGGAALALITVNGWNSKDLSNTYFKDAQDQRSSAQTTAFIGYGIAGAGAVVTGVGVWMLTRGSDDGAQVSLFAAPGTAAASVSGRF